MSLTLSGVDIRVLTHELAEDLIGSWIVNIYHIRGNIFIFKIRKPKVGVRFLLIEPGKRMHLTQFNRLMPSEPSNFCRNLRTHLRDRRINSIEQREMDRIISINVGADSGITIIIELFGQGNLIMVSGQNKILTALHYRKMRDRDIHPGKKYEHMPSTERDIIRNGISDLQKYLDANKKIIIALNSWLGLGPYYSRYIARQAGISTKKTAEITEEDIVSILQAAKELESRLLNFDFSPVVYLDSEMESESDEEIAEEDEDKLDGEINYDEQWSDESLPFNPERVLKILPWEQSLYEEEVETFQPMSYSDAFDVFFSSQETEEEISGETEELTTAEEKLQTQLNKQNEHKQNLLIEAAIKRREADALYNNFTAATELLSTVYNARKNKMEWEDIIERLDIGKEKGIASASLYNEILVREALIILELPFEDEIIKSTLDFRRTLNENANMLYEKAKKSEKKAKGADIAIDRTTKNLEILNSQTDVLKKISDAQTVVLKRRKSWFEKWHWTNSPDGSLIIAGRDANSNELLVKRYLDDDDLFLHADIQGAAATIIKTGGKIPNENTLKCAATIAVSYSAAWKLQRPTADAYAVENDQVSMSAPTGQFLPKGGFMIYGKKQFIKNVALELYLYAIIEKHWVKLGIAVHEENLKYVDLFVKITPGSIKRGQVSKQIKKKFLSMVDDKDMAKIKSIDIGDIAQLLPGDCKTDNWTKREK